jgi:hypothetical protein
VSFAVPFWVTQVESGMAANKKAPMTVVLQNERSPYDGHSGRSYLHIRKPLKAAAGTDPLQSSSLHGN